MSERNKLVGKNTIKMDLKQPMFEATFIPVNFSFVFSCVTNI